MVIYYFEKFWSRVPALCTAGAFGVDFSSLDSVQDVSKEVSKVSRGLLEHGVTAYCPTLVTSSWEYYHKVLPFIRPTEGGPDGAAVLGEYDLP